MFEGDGYKFPHLGLTFQASNASLQWAAETLGTHPGLPTIPTTHECLSPKAERTSLPANDNSLVDPEDNNAAAMREKFISQQEQIFLVLCGHRLGPMKLISAHKNQALARGDGKSLRTGQLIRITAQKLRCP